MNKIIKEREELKGMEGWMEFCLMRMRIKFNREGIAMVRVIFRS